MTINFLLKEKTDFSVCLCCHKKSQCAATQKTEVITTKVILVQSQFNCLLYLNKLCLYSISKYLHNCIHNRTYVSFFLLCYTQFLKEGFIQKRRQRLLLLFGDRISAILCHTSYFARFKEWMSQEFILFHIILVQFIIFVISSWCKIVSAARN